MEVDLNQYWEYSCFPVVVRHRTRLGLKNNPHQTANATLTDASKILIYRIPYIEGFFSFQFEDSSETGTLPKIVCFLSSFFSIFQAWLSP